MISQRSFFEQNVSLHRRGSRIDYIHGLVANKSVLHVGCADWPIYDSDNNLHIKLFSMNNRVDGYDNNINVINLMKSHPLLKDAELYTEIPNKTYDCILIPETIEHVNNVESFLMNFVKCITSDTIILITAPNAFARAHIQRNIDTHGNFIEIVHPDHNYWYSPYTLPNTIQKVYSANNIRTNLLEIGTLETDTMVYCLFTLSI